MTVQPTSARRFITPVPRHRVVASAWLALSVAVLSVAPPRYARAQAPDWSAVEDALGRKGTTSAERVIRFGFPRSDLQVTVRGLVVRPTFALGSWVAFQQLDSAHAMVMGDLVLLEDEVGPVMRALQAGNVEQTALHNHVLGESPRVLYMHLRAHGEAVAIAQAIRAALAKSATPLAPPASPPTAVPLALDTATVTRVLGFAGRANGGVYQVNVPRAESISEGGHVIPASMGLATAINMQPTGAGRMAITGDFVLLPGEVNAVMRVLRENGIDVTAVHSHMLDESPRLFFMHFWANDDVATLARGLHAALERTNSVRGSP